MNIKTANRLVDLRKKHGYSQEELASALNLSRQTISKWERSEASPDTDNLIALANLYGMSLDELLGIKEENYDEEDLASSVDQNEDSFTDDEDPETKEEKEKKRGVHISDEGIIVNDVHIDSSGVYGDGFSISGSGIKVMKSEPSSDDPDDENNYAFHVEYEDEFRQALHAGKKWKDQFIIVSGLRAVFFLLALLAFILVGCLVPGGWTWSWTFFLAADIIPSLVSAIMKKKFCVFNIVLTVTFAYLLPGMLIGAWHPNWILFLIIPLYYIVFTPIDNLIWIKRVTKWSKENIIDGKVKTD